MKKLLEASERGGGQLQCGFGYAAPSGSQTFSHLVCTRSRGTKTAVLSCDCHFQCVDAEGEHLEWPGIRSGQSQASCPAGPPAVYTMCYRPGLRCEP